jgi:hypothetical protein
MLSLRPFFRLLAGLTQGVQYSRGSDGRFRLLSFWRIRPRLPIIDWLRRSRFSYFDRLLLSWPFQHRRPDLQNALASAFQFRQ